MTCWTYNDVSVQIGKDTLCEMHTAGVLTGSADKILRGTVDFRRGAKRGVGHESEDVLLFSPTARNRTAPLILCGEEEVEGQHAASVGRLDESKLYYLRSRGLSESQARRLMVDARFAPAIEKIPLEELRTRCAKLLHGGLMMNTGRLISRFWRPMKTANAWSIWTAPPPPSTPSRCWTRW